jgi:hypothetical protein
MKKSELTVGMIVENQRGTRFRVVSDEGWKNSNGFSLRSTGVEVDGHPVRVVGYRGATGVLAVREGVLTHSPEGEPVAADILQLRFVVPEGTWAAQQKAEQERYEAKVDADAAFDADLLARARAMWGDRADALMAEVGVLPDDGLLTKSERGTLATIIIAGRYR